MLFPKVKEEE